CNGLLILNEGIQKTVLGALTFGLLDGWWRYEDEDLRIPGSPLLSPDSWQRVLEQEGFPVVLYPARSAIDLGQQIIVAESDGWIRQTDRVYLQLGRVGNAVLPTIDITDGGQNSIAHPTLFREHVIDGILKALSLSLKIPKDSIENDQPFSDYGIDSILGTAFVKQVNEALGVAMNTAIIFDHTSVERLADYVLATYGKELSAGFQQQADDTVARASRIAINAPDAAPAEPQTTSASIAIIGMSGQFPGAKDVDAFWQNLVAGKDCIAELPAHYRDNDAKQAYRWGGILEDRDCFDPLFFNISPREAESMNPHQRLILQESWKALEDAGYNPKCLAGEQACLYIGAEPTGYFHESFTGSSDATIASRLSYFLNLKGPAIVVNTGCSSSGVAIHLACESLRHAESNV
ncbi:MAG: hypothetical protein EPN89_20255, partial [Methylovulum sp.]